MTIVVDTANAPSVIEKVIEIFEMMNARDPAAVVEARTAVTEHVFGLIAAGQTDQQRLVVSGLAHLKSLERMAKRQS